LINPKYLNQGFGKKIVFKALQMAYNDLKLNEISLIVRKNHQVAINLYSKFGFVITGEEQQTIDNSNIDFFKMKHKGIK
jgi:RimJ/RimL family protein N-acetyltransferase